MKKLNIFKKTVVKLICVILLLSLSISELGCKKFLEVRAPITSVNSGSVFSEDASAIAAVTGIYAKMVDKRLSRDFALYPELSSDNLADLGFNTDYASYYQNVLSGNSDAADLFWGPIYNYVYQTNAAIEGVIKSEKLTPTVKQQLLGETYFLRAFFYFCLVNLYGDVPLVLTTDYNVNNKLPRATEHNIYDQIVSDLGKAKDLLNDSYLDATLLKPTEDRIRPNKMAAYALLSRVSLYLENYANAETYASKVISLTDSYSSMVPLDKVFLKNSRETIWALQPIAATRSTNEANFFMPSDDGLLYVGFPKTFLDSFEAGDERVGNWIASIPVGSSTNFYPIKYKERTSTMPNEYSIVLRVAELYLIRSEARAKQGDIRGAQDDLNVIRHRAGLQNTNASTTAALLTSILKERRAELFTEWGQRWFDLKRTGEISQAMKFVETEKNNKWQPFQAFYPIPIKELRLNGNLKQNPGYSN